MKSLHELFPSFVRQEVPLSVYTRLQLGGSAEYFAEPENEAELSALLKYCQEQNISVRILGAGTRLIVSDAGVSGVVAALHKPEFCRMSTEGSTITAGAGVSFGQVITQSVSQGLGGIEAFVGMGGSFGGAVSGNIGTIHGGDLGQWVEMVQVVKRDGSIFVLAKNEITFGYRCCSLDDAVILSATLRLEKDDPKTLAKRMQKLWIIRKMQQSVGSAGSVIAFENPETGQSAGELIEQVGLKGARIGGAVISDHAADSITIEPGCVSEDVVRLIDLVQEQVKLNTEIDLISALKVW